MTSRRTLVNLVAFLVFSALLVVYVAFALLFPKGGDRTVQLEFRDAVGLAPRNDVTMRGVPVGAVESVRLTPRGTARVVVRLDPGATVPGGTTAQIMRRSAIGDIVIELRPGRGPTIPDGGSIGLRATRVPPDPERTIEVLARVLHAVPSDDLSTLVAELAAGVRGRGEDLATLSRAGARIPEALLEVRRQLESLIRNGPKVTGVLADNAPTLADDIRQTALLADILRDRRFDLLELSREGATFSEVAAGLLAKDKANIACLVAGLGAVNATLGSAEHLANVKGALELNHYFFDGMWQSVRHSRDGLDWFRVQLLPHQEPSARQYEQQRPTPDVLAGDACRSRYGRGVGPVTQGTGPFLAPGSRLHPGR